MSHPAADPSTAWPPVTAAPDRIRRGGGRHRRRPTLLAHEPGDRLLAGVAAGLADRLGVAGVVVRLAFVILAFAGGAGVILYLVLWLVTSGSEPPAPEGQATASRGPQGPGTLERTLGAALVVGGIVVILRTMGAWFGDGVVGPAALASIGSAVIWSRPRRSPPTPSGRAAGSGERAGGFLPGPFPKLRLVVGSLLIVAGIAAFLAANDAFAVAAIRNALFTLAVVAVGAALILGPGAFALARQLTDERRERIRSEERSRMAAHLHDSVLQSLALIQRARTPQEMVSLARGQERELRAWLYGRPGLGPDSLAGAVEEAAARVERLYQVPVEVVTVGDRRLDDRLGELVQASGEAMANAARHSGAPSVAVYVEVEADAVSAFVRDEGRGFDPSSVPRTRRGIADSIRGRMVRAGGTAVIQTVPGEGTEVRLRLSVSPNGAGRGADGPGP